ncbi:MAG: hypothetical protein KC910_04270 [Candidatus Eremiobacteraeota bacterium]|nr:hypothetical protein [Candidatus Eremiobacteraeota bacterium]
MMAFWKKLLGSFELGPEWADMDFVAGKGLPESVSRQPRQPVVLPGDLAPGVSFMGDFAGEFEGEFVVVVNGRKQAHQGDGRTPYFRVAFFPTAHDPALWSILEARLPRLYQRVLEHMVGDYENGPPARASAIARMLALKAEPDPEPRELAWLEGLPVFEDIGGNEDEPLLLTLADLRQASAVLAGPIGRIPPPSHRPGVYFLDEDELDQLVCVYELSWPGEMDLSGPFVSLEERAGAPLLDLSGVSRRGQVYHFAVGEGELVLDLAARRLRLGSVQFGFDELVRCDLERVVEHADTTRYERYFLALSDGPRTLVLTARCDPGDDLEREILHALPAALGFARPRLADWSLVGRELAELIG